MIVYTKSIIAQEKELVNSVAGLNSYYTFLIIETIRLDVNRKNKKIK
jgi:hypothetical protein